MKIMGVEIDEKDIVKGKAKPFTPEQAASLSKSYNGMCDPTPEQAKELLKKRKDLENKEFRNYVNGKN